MLKRIRELFGRRGRNPLPDASGATISENRNDAPGDGPAAGPPEVHQGPRAIHQPIPESDLDPDAVKIVRRLMRFDHIAYLVGGCVRDLLLDRKPKDFDIATSATPRQVKRAFRNCRIVGRRFRLAHVYFHDGKIIEVATFRAGADSADSDDIDDGSAPDGDDLMIRDDNVFGTPEQDALRRDFTINQLFYDVGAGTVLDHAGGLDDLRRGIVRTIGDPEIRFREDPIRILRAIKFAARLGFQIESGTARAIERTRGEIPRAAAPRVLEEINRFCRGGAAVRSFELMRETHVVDAVLPEFHEEFAGDGFEWNLLRAFLERFDRRVAAGDPPSTGTIFAALLLPQLIDTLGWDPAEGRATRPRGVDARRRADELLKPTALRLRVSRRDQEHVRQLVLSLFRMVPSKRIRAASKRAMLNRACFADAVEMLEVLGERFGGEFAEAATYWRGLEPPEGDAASDDADARPDRDRDGQDRPAKRRRRRRRGGRGRGKDSSRSTDGDTGTPAPAAAKARKSGDDRKPKPSGGSNRDDLPPVWDDRYFFAALPTVPEGVEAPERPPSGSDDDASSPRDADADSRGDRPTNEATRASEDDEPAPPRRRRRRRGGRGRRKRSDASASPSRGADS